MLPCNNLRDLEEQRGRGFLNLSYGGKGKSHKQEELLWGAIKKLPKELTTELHCLELPTITASCGVKTFESIFPLGSIFIYIIDFFINLQMATE